MKNRILIPILLATIFIPQIVFAAWWNPFSWSIFSWIFEPQPAAVIQTLETDEVATSTQDIPTATTTISDTKKDSVKKSVVKPTPAPKPQMQPTISGQTTTSTAQVTSTTTTNYKDAELELIKQQNEILKQQLQAQQQIAQNTTPVNGACSTTLNICTTGTLNDVTDTSTHYLWSCKGSNEGSTASCSLPVPSFEFNPTVEVGGATGYGFLHSEFKDTGCLGCDLTDIGWVYITMPTDLSDGEITISDKGTIKLKPGINKIDGIAANKNYTWSAVARSSSTSKSTKTGTFTSRSPRLVAVPEGGEANNGLIFMNYGVIENGLTISTIIRFQGSGQDVEVGYMDKDRSNYLYKVIPMVNDGDTLTLSDISHHIWIRSINGSAPWTNNQSVKFKIISATATYANGNPVEFYY